MQDSLQKAHKAHALTKNEFMKIAGDFIEDTRKDTKQKCIGCTKLCPCCHAKCQKPDGHALPHSTDYHLLKAFGKCHEAETKVLSVDICNTTTNQDSIWDVNGQEVKFPQFIAQKWPEWNPISPKDFNKQNALKMLKVYFDGGLQDYLINNQQWSTTKYKAAQKWQVKFKDLMLESDWPYKAPAVVPHVIFVIDSSGSMDDTDIRPTTQAKIINHGDLDNRLGASYEKMHNFIATRLKRNARDVISLVLFDDEYKVVFERKQIHPKLVEENCLGEVEWGGTDFKAAMDGAMSLVKKDEHTMVVFLTDGESRDDGATDVVKQMKQKCQLQMSVIMMKSNNIPQVLNDIATEGGTIAKTANSEAELQDRFDEVARQLERIGS